MTVEETKFYENRMESTEVYTFVFIGLRCLHRSESRPFQCTGLAGEPFVQRKAVDRIINAQSPT